MYCTKCGACISDDVIACPECGCATKNFQSNATIRPVECRRDEQLARGRKQSAYTRWCIAGALIIAWGVYAFLLNYARLNIVSMGLAVIVVLLGSALLGVGITKYKNDKSRDKQDDSINV